MTDIFATIEDIKDGYVVDTMYGKYFEAIFTSPIMDEKLDNHISSLSLDRSLRLNINSDFSIEYHKQNENGTVSPISLEKLKL